MEISTSRGPRAQPPTRTCVACAVRDAATAMVRLVVAGDEVAVDLAGKSFGRGAHVHARPDCLAKAPHALARSFRRPVRIDAAELARRVAAVADVRLAGLLLAARRARGLAVGADAALLELRAGGPMLVVVAADAGSVVSSAEVGRATAAGQAIVWSTKTALGALLGEQAVAICAVRHAGIAREIMRTRVAASAAATVTADASVRQPARGRAAQRKDEGTECSRRPEAR